MTKTCAIISARMKSSDPLNNWGAKMLDRFCLEAVGRGVNRFITGGAWGMETYAAMNLLRHRAAGRIASTVRVEIAAPWPDYTDRWPLNPRLITDGVNSQADQVIAVLDGYERGAYPKRNEWMVDHADEVFVVNPPSVLDMNIPAVIQRAARRGIPLLDINPDAEEIEWKFR